MTNELEANTANVTQTFNFSGTLQVGNGFRSVQGNTSITSTSEIEIGKLSFLPSSVTTK